MMWSVLLQQAVKVSYDGSIYCMFLTHLLYCLTLTTLHLPNFEPVHLMVLLCIMTQPANIQLTTARCLQYIEAHER